MDGAKDVEVGGGAHVALVGREAEDRHRQPLLRCLLLGQPTSEGTWLSLAVDWFYSHIFCFCTMK